MDHTTRKRDNETVKTALIACFVLAASTAMMDQAHSVSVEPPTERIENPQPSTPEESQPSPMGYQKGVAHISFHVFGFERSLTDLALKLTLDIDYNVTEDGWLQDKVEYTVTGKVENIEKFYNTIESLTEKFQLTKEPLVRTTD